MFDPRVGEVHPVFLVNTGPAPLSEVVVTVGSPAGDPTSPLTSRKLDENDGTVSTGTGVLIDSYSIYVNGDVLTGYGIDYIGADGVRCRAQAFVGKGGSPGRWVKLKTVAVEHPAWPPMPSASI